MLFLLADSLFSMEKLMPFAVFCFFALIAWWLLTVFAAGKPKAETRLEEYRNPAKRRSEERDGRKLSAMNRVLEATAPLAKALEPKTEAEAGKIKQKLVQAGFRQESAKSFFLGAKFGMLLLGLVLAGGTTALTYGLTKNAMLACVFVGGVMFYVPDVVLWFIGYQRRDQIFFTLPDVLDLLVVCVEAGLGLDQGMRKVSEEMKKSAPVLTEELSLCNFQLQMGRPRHDVLHELGSRTNVDDLRALAAILIQADKFGSSIAQALRVQSDSMRTRRRQLAEEKAAKTAVKLIFPLVIFIFPAIFVVLVGPAAITIVNEMFPMMSGQAGK
jgi:tight adherence protein C